MVEGSSIEKLLPVDLNRSLTDTIYERLVDAIATDKLPPGARLNQRDLAEQLMVSRQPVSHALHRLKASGLATETGRKGLVVAPVDPLRLRDLYELRTEIEGLVAARAAANIRAGTAAPADRERLVQLIAFGAGISESTSVLDCILADVEFHLCLYRLCGSAVVSEAIAPLWPHFRRSMGKALSIYNHRMVSWEGHNAIARAVLGGDPEAARQAARRHIEIAGREALRTIGSLPPAAPTKTTGTNARARSHIH